MNPHSTISPRFDIVVQIGAFQPWLQIHQQALESALTLGAQVIVLFTDADKPASAGHPFLAAESAQVLRRALPESAHGRVHALGLRQNTHPGREWADVLQRAQRLADTAEPKLAILQAPDTPRRAWPNVTVIPYPAEGDSGEGDFTTDGPATGSPGRVWRDAVLGDALPQTGYDPHGMLVPSTRPWFEQWLQAPLREHLRDEWRLLRDEREAWAVAPYPPTLVTVDCVVECADHVLLVRRGRAPGKGLLALPGGFIDVHETLLQSACRELQEETGLRLPATTLPNAVAVFDAPERSQRGRVITHAYHFILHDEQRPVPQAGDDAAQACWTPLAELAARIDEFHDDHALILDHFLKVLPPGLVMPLAE